MDPRIRDVIVKLPLGLKILRNQFHAPQAHVVVGGSGGIPPHNFFCFLDAKWCILTCECVQIATRFFHASAQLFSILFPASSM